MAGAARWRLKSARSAVFTHRLEPSTRSGGHERSGNKEVDFFPNNNVLTHKVPFYFLPNFLSTGLGERFCALWRMLHLASAAAHDKRAGGQDRVTRRVQRGAELRSSSSLRVSRCRAATVTGGCTRRGATRARGGLGVCTASLIGPAACTARLYGTAIGTA